MLPLDRQIEALDRDIEARERLIEWLNDSGGLAADIAVEQSDLASLRGARETLRNVRTLAPYLAATEEPYRLRSLAEQPDQKRDAGQE